MSPRPVPDPERAPGTPGSLKLAGSEKPKALGATEVARAFLERMSQAGGEHSTVKLTRNAKGDTQIEVSVRTGESNEIVSVEDAAGKAKEVYDLLRTFYPMSPPDEAGNATRKAHAMRDAKAAKGDA